MASEVSLILIPCVNQPASTSMLLAVEETPMSWQGFFSDLNLVTEVPSRQRPLFVFKSHSKVGACVCLILLSH